MVAFKWAVHAFQMSMRSFFSHWVSQYFRFESFDILNLKKKLWKYFKNIFIDSLFLDQKYFGIFVVVLIDGLFNGMDILFLFSILFKYFSNENSTNDLLKMFFRYFLFWW